MSTLMLRLAGPLQSWGDSSRFNHRKTRGEPTKSGVLGLLAAAEGRRRTDPIEDLTQLKFAVRVDEPGTVLRDFQTEIDWRTSKSQPLTHRYYLSDAVFVAAVEGDDALISGLHDALLRPAFPLYLGRRSCPPSQRILLGIRDVGFREAIAKEKWRASKRYRKSLPRTGVRLPIVRDRLEHEDIHETIRDVPVSFDVRDRNYQLREVVHEFSDVIENPDGRVVHDPMSLVEES